MPAILWAGLIFVASSMPASRLQGWILHRFDKAVHVVIFYILGLLVHRALRGPDSSSSPTSWRIPVMLLIVLGYGFFDEVHQAGTPGRSVDVKDFLADAAGGLLAAATAFIHHRMTVRRERTTS